MSGTISPRQQRHYESLADMRTQGSFHVIVGDFPDDDEPVMEITFRANSGFDEKTKELVDLLLPGLKTFAKAEDCRVVWKN